MITLTTAIALGFLHTLLGPDHYLPFIVIGRARRWSLGRTALLTVVCGLGHVASSILLGLVGAAAGVALGTLQGFEATRGELAAWSLIVFGAGYTAFGLWRALRGRSHGHVHLHQNGTIHKHGHGHKHVDGHPSVHAHLHHQEEPPVSWKQLTPWLLFIVFVLGPCEPLIPLFFAEAVSGAWRDAVGIALGYGCATVATMLLIVSVAWLSLRRLTLGPLERFSHVLAGAVILFAGLGMAFLGL